MTLFDQKLWVFGGSNGEETLDDLWNYDLLLKKWLKVVVKEFPEPRRGHSMVTYSSFMFLFGGIQDITKEKNDVYIFEFAKSNWSKIHTTTNRVYDCSPTLKP